MFSQYELKELLEENNHDIARCYDKLHYNKHDAFSRRRLAVLLDERVDLLQDYNDAYDKEQTQC